MSDELTPFTGALETPLPEAEVQTAGGRTAAFGFIFVSAVAAAMSIGLMVPILPNLLKQFTGGDAGSASEWNTLFAVCGGLMSFFAGPVLGLLSDRYGRRPVLLISMFGLGLDFLFMAFAPALGWLFIGRLISGATSGLFSTANAYVADVTPPEGRARAFGWMGSAFSFGFLAGPAIGGALGNYSLRLPFIAGAIITLLNALYGLLILPESLAREKRLKAFDWRRANPLGSLRLLQRHHDLFRLGAVSFLNQLAQMLWPSIFVLYTGYRYGWTPMFTGFTMMAGSLLGIGVQSFLVAPVVKNWGERGAVLLGGSSITIAMVWYGIAPTGWLYLLGMPFGCLGGLIIPGLQGMMTRHVGPSEQGQLQGANQCLIGMSSVLGPIIYGLSFAWAVRHPEYNLPGIGQFLAATIMATAVFLAIGERTPVKS